MKDIFIGVDGGATKSTIRIEDSEGGLIGKEISGPASIRLSVEDAWQSINQAIEKILQPQGIPYTDNESYRFHAGMGLAGCELINAHQAFIKASHIFHTLVLSSDAHTACLGAHNGQDGAIIIVGTGVVGYQLDQGHVSKVSGWGFPHDDEGSGAWLGLQAIKATLQWLDGRLPESELAKAVYFHFGENQQCLITWANQATSTHFAELAPLVIQQSQCHDAIALNIMQQAAKAIDRVGMALQNSQCHSQQVLPCVLLGGIAPAVALHLEEALRLRLSNSYAPSDAGAILLIRSHLKAAVI